MFAVRCAHANTFGTPQTRKTLSEIGDFEFYDMAKRFIIKENV